MFKRVEILKKEKVVLERDHYDSILKCLETGQC